MRNRYFLLLIVFVSGMTTMAVEMSASRLLAPYFGTSLIIWANLIGLILIYLTAGYYLGGKLADRHPSEGTLYQITAWAGFLIGLIPFVARPVLRFSMVGFATYSVGIFLGSLLGVIALFAVPIILLGCVSPFAIRLAVRDVETTGNIAGGIYALSTLGSIIGTFLPVLALIPTIGTRKTFLLFSLILLGTSVVGLMRTRRRLLPVYMLLLVIVVALGLFAPGGLIKSVPGLVYETESPYHYIQVVQDGGNTYLVLNEGQAVHSVYNPDSVLAYGIWDYFLMAPYFNPDQRQEDVNSLLLIGLAAGTVARQYTAVYGDIPIDGVEIDPDIVRVARRYFNMNESNLNAIVQDGRYFLETTDRQYDVIGIDAYRQPYIPFHLTTREFFSRVRDHLTEDGVVAINAGRTETDYRLVDVLASTMKSVFPSVFVIDAQRNLNSLIVGTVQPTHLENFTDNVAQMTHPLLLDVAARALPRAREAQQTAMVFTDDLAPVEQVIDQIILGYVLELE